MYVSIEERIKEITKGVCPYKNKVCDGLCNNCGILAKSENTFTKIIPSKQGCVCTWDDLDALENMAMSITGDY